ncbi:MarR family transcriptional regulator [Burkholderia stagnalis]|uniref:MarR family transcriptional regulator n=1 Tax=Burkholderia stagnalis TaxID=1503054 RepID=A0A119MUU1_9BURK|nr:MarR family winged helix-turn-helix transcriptional regulator [Burkholderia stagnalis]KVC52961.1 MarR family transcriptional regulator [Burkholderia stagnalis]KVM94397.1 MarR family transcriptional regulator [Burkholderia stagnalis]KVN20894.1 MarR family transcriptional regulator [Burkholderia stagnalis]KVZ09502.1 MarR family transcriptional regulator [Burkholderia stagnalis]KWA47423.1 MarR family transcriptional regulator [Burkholderia stagnalis]
MADRFSPPDRRDVSRELDAVRSILGVHASIKRLFEQATLTALGMPFSQGRALVHLARGEAVSCQALARSLGCGAGRMSRLVDDLEKRAWVVRRRHDDDRRTLDLALTPAGLALAERIPAVLAEVRRGVLNRLSAQERAVLKRFLERMLGEIDGQPG